MQLTAVFESWHIGDGNYPPLDVGQLVRLSFELEPVDEPRRTTDPRDRLQHLGEAEYEGIGQVVGSWSGLTVLKAGDFHFYIGRALPGLPPGSRCEFRGTLLLDHFAWVENRGNLMGSPNLLVNLRVVRIRKISLPERVVARTDQGKSFPTRVPPSDYGDVIELDTMQDQAFDEEFYVIDFDGAGLENASVPITFQ